MGDNKRKILVTGAKGFVGSALVGELQSAGAYEILGLVSARKKKIEIDDSPDIKMFEADISEYETLRDAEKEKGIDTVVHTAGLAHQFGRTAREDFWRVNVRGTENICRLAKTIGAGHFVLISSVSVYGDYGDAEIFETFEPRPEGDYAESKLASESAAIEFCAENQLPLTILRLGTVIGEGDRGNTARLITLIDRNRFLWIGKGTNKKSLIYKGDAAGGIRRAIERHSGNRPKIYNLTAPAIEMAEIVGAISQSLQKTVPRISIPESLVRMVLKAGRRGIRTTRLKILEKNVDKWLSDDIFSGRKFSEEFGFKPETAIPEALDRQVRFYLEQTKF